MKDEFDLSFCTSTGEQPVGSKIKVYSFPNFEQHRSSFSSRLKHRLGTLWTRSLIVHGSFR